MHLLSQISNFTLATATITFAFTLVATEHVIMQSDHSDVTTTNPSSTKRFGLTSTERFGLTSAEVENFIK
jgi:hypothetical protein